MLDVTRRTGFTVLELLVAVIVVGLLVGIAIAQLADSRERAHDATMQAGLRNYALFQEDALGRMGRYASPSEALEEDFAFAPGVFPDSSDEGADTWFLRVGHESSRSLCEINYTDELLDVRNRVTCSGPGTGSDATGAAAPIADFSVSEVEPNAARSAVLSADALYASPDGEHDPLLRAAPGSVSPGHSASIASGEGGDILSFPAGVDLFFDGSSSRQSGGASIVDYEWSIETYEISKNLYFMESFPSSFDATVTLRVTNSDGLSAARSRTLRILGGAPVAAFSHTPAHPLPGDTVTFDAGASHSPDGRPLTFRWDFGAWSDPITTMDPEVSLVYPDAGEFSVHLRVTDDIDRSGEQSGVVRVSTDGEGEPLSFTRSTLGAGWGHSIALRSDGSLASWGGDGASMVSGTPSGNDFVSVVAGEAHSLALRNDGTLTSWGANWFGAVSQTPGDSDFVAIAAAGAHSLALRSDGSIVSWGSDHHGKVSDTPGGNDFVAIAARSHHSVAMRSDGSLVSWGRDDHGQVSNTPTRSGFTGIGLSGGGGHTVALHSDGTLATWGHDGYNEVSGMPGGSAYRFVGGSAGAPFAVRTDGTLTAWGWDEHGQISQIPAGGDFVAVTGGAAHGLALRSDGTLASWGYDDTGQVSDTPTTGGFAMPTPMR